MDRQTRNGFALGLVAGISVALILLLFGQSLLATIDCVLMNDCSTLQQLYGVRGGDRPMLLQRLVRAEHSLAQWLIACLTLVATAISAVAVLLVLKTLNVTRDTLIATQQMNLTTRSIGEVQTRAYISIGETEVKIDDTECRIDIVMRNRGQSPARRLRVTARPKTSQNPERSASLVPFPIDRRSNDFSSILDLGPGETFHLRVRIPINGNSSEVWDPETFGFSVTASATYFDIYGKRRKLVYFGWITESLYKAGETRLIKGNRFNRGT